jgi:polar amino acid transport system permease protein
MGFDLAPIVDSWTFLAYGLLTTLILSGLTIALGLAVGVIVGLLRTYAAPWLDFALSLYVDTARAVPPLVILVWTYFAFPILIGQSLSPLEAGTIALGLHLGAYVAEVIRAGLTSIRPGQMRAGLALGMSRLQVIRVIIMPQAVIRMLPALGSLAVIAVKDSSPR